MTVVSSWGTKGASVLVGGQFGSEGKGAAAAYLAMKSKSCTSIATTNAGAQAGHTAIISGHKWVNFHLPTTGVIQGNGGMSFRNGDCASYINAGSIIDPASLAKELADCQISVDSVTIHPRAAVITDDNRATERAAGSSTEKTASTQKGVGAAITDKVMRRARLAGDVLQNDYCVHPIDLNLEMAMRGSSVVVEVPQGMDLSLNHGLAYPYTTSRDCWVGSGCSDAGIHPDWVESVCMVVRTMPIRVGNIYNEMNELLGTSGPFWLDSKELDWGTDFPGLEPERTTVTKRVRRIASWSGLQYARGLSLNRPNLVYLNFANYLRSRNEFQHLVRVMKILEAMAKLPEVTHIYGFGPAVEDVTENYDKAMAWYEKRSF